jgi:hypothetical protein
VEHGNAGNCVERRIAELDFYFAEAEHFLGRFSLIISQDSRLYEYESYSPASIEEMRLSSARDGRDTDFAYIEGSFNKGGSQKGGKFA